MRRFVKSHCNELNASHQNLYMEALIPSTSEYNLIWRQGHCRCIQTEVITGLGPSPVWPKKEETRAQACPQREHCVVRALPVVAQQQLRNTEESRCSERPQTDSLWQPSEGLWQPDLQAFILQNRESETVNLDISHQFVVLHYGRPGKLIQSANQ